MEKMYYYVMTIVYNDGRVSNYKFSRNYSLPKVWIIEDLIQLRNRVSREVYEQLLLEEK